MLENYNIEGFDDLLNVLYTEIDNLIYVLDVLMKKNAFSPDEMFFINNYINFLSLLLDYSEHFEINKRR